MADLLKILIFLSGSAALGFILGRRSRNSDVAVHEHQADEQRRAFVEVKGRLERCTSKRAGLERELSQLKKGKPTEKKIAAAKTAPVTQPKKQDAPKSKAPNLAPPKPKKKKAKPPKVVAKTKQEEALERVKANAQKIDFDRIGRSSEAEKDDLKKIKGVGPFLEKKLNTLGIYTFTQIANFTDDDKERVNEAIEFFPGRISRDNWVDQAKDLQQSA